MTADRNAGIFASSTETPPRSRSRIFTYRKMKIATSPFVYRGAHVFMPEKLGNLQQLFPTQWGHNTMGTKDKGQTTEDRGGTCENKHSYLQLSVAEDMQEFSRSKPIFLLPVDNVC